MGLDRCRDALSPESPDSYIASRVRAIRQGATRYEPPIFATIHPSARECLLEAAPPTSKDVRRIVYLLDLVPLAAVRTPMSGDHYRMTSGTADGLEFHRLFTLMGKYRLGVIGTLKVAGSSTVVLVSPLDAGFDLALVHAPARAKNRRFPSFPEPRLIQVRVATNVLELLCGLDAAGATQDRARGSG
ncbi:hypothetical protein LVJ94_17185 [Pendulispora rubella]|uniref:Uncharacterized protein n=1 Tax=Pendulispora rubella TaxID=2741070 RepID=A0ABZ2LGQ5_9BACT